jgi:LysR family transcriptional regulator, hydrogen peroxide-inducible genes activator
MEPTLKQLKYLKAVAEQGSFRRAAEFLHVSQPTLTAQITVLEEKLGRMVLERSRQGAKLTPVGRSMMPHITAIGREISALIHLAEQAENNLSGTYRLGVPPTIGPYLLPEVIPALHRTFPGLKIFVHEKGPRDLELGLVNGDYDFILTSRPMEIPHLATAALYVEPLNLVCALDHPFASRDHILPIDMKGQSLLAIEEKHRLFVLMQAIATQYDAKLLRDYEGTSLDTLKHMISTGLGIAFLPSLYVRLEIDPRKDVLSVPFKGDSFSREILLAWRQGSPQTEFFKKIATLIREQCQQNLAKFIVVG